MNLRKYIARPLPSGLQRKMRGRLKGHQVILAGLRFSRKLSTEAEERRVKDRQKHLYDQSTVAHGEQWPASPAGAWLQGFRGRGGKCSYSHHLLCFPSPRLP